MILDPGKLPTYNLEDCQVWTHPYPKAINENTEPAWAQVNWWRVPLFTYFCFDSGPLRITSSWSYGTTMFKQGYMKPVAQDPV